MRAARVLDMLLVLQRRGRSTAAELAERLEVSERTILRDVEALGEAGVPIVSIRGVGGGIELLDGFETRLTGLTEQEASAVFLAGTPEVAKRLGLAQPARRAQQKLLEALSAGVRDRAEELAEWFLHDPWADHDVPSNELRRLADCIRRHREVEVVLGNRAPVVVRPLGLVLKAGSWFVVSAEATGPAAVAIDDLQSTRITRRPFEPPADFSLAGFWEEQTSLRGREGGG